MDTLDEAVAATLRAERAAADLSQRQVAEASGLSPQTVMRLERAERSPTVVQLVVLASVFGLSASELMRRAEQRLARR